MITLIAGLSTPHSTYLTDSAISVYPLFFAIKMRLQLTINLFHNLY